MPHADPPQSCSRASATRSSASSAGRPGATGQLPAGWRRSTRSCRAASRCGALSELRGGPASGKTAVALSAMPAALARGGALRLGGRARRALPAGRGGAGRRPGAAAHRAARSRRRGRRPWPALWAAEALLGSGAFAAVVAIDVPLGRAARGADAVAPPAASGGRAGRGGGALALARRGAAVRAAGGGAARRCAEGGRVGGPAGRGGPGAGAGGGGPCGLIRSRAPRASPARPGPGAAPGRRGCSRSTCPTSRCSGSGGSLDRPASFDFAPGGAALGTTGSAAPRGGTGARWRWSRRGGCLLRSGRARGGGAAGRDAAQALASLRAALDRRRTRRPPIAPRCAALAEALLGLAPAVEVAFPDACCSTPAPPTCWRGSGRRRRSAELAERGWRPARWPPPASWASRSRAAVATGRAGAGAGPSRLPAACSAGCRCRRARRRWRSRLPLAALGLGRRRWRPGWRAVGVADVGRAGPAAGRGAGAPLRPGRRGGGAAGPRRGRHAARPLRAGDAARRRRSSWRGRPRAPSRCSSC